MCWGNIGTATSGGRRRASGAAMAAGDDDTLYAYARRTLRRAPIAGRCRCSRPKATICISTPTVPHAIDELGLTVEYDVPGPPFPTSVGRPRGLARRG